MQDFFRDNAVLNNMQGMSYTGSWGRIGESCFWTHGYICAVRKVSLAFLWIH